MIHFWIILTFLLPSIGEANSVNGGKEPGDPVGAAASPIPDAGKSLAPPTSNTSAQKAEMPTVRAASLAPADRITKMRDPFMMPESALPLLSGIPKSDLERFAVDQFKLLGVVTGPSRLRALVISPEGKTYFIAEKMKMGLRNGLVRKIAPSVVLVREKVVNVVGQEENIDTEIRLPPEGKVGVVETAPGMKDTHSASNRSEVR